MGMPTWVAADDPTLSDLLHDEGITADCELTAARDRTQIDPASTM
jgi:hypothetical protein